MNDIEILELLSRKIEEQNSIIVSCSSIVNKKAEAKERTEYIEIKRFVENLIQRNKDLEEIEQEHKEENGRLREKNINLKEKIIRQQEQLNIANKKILAQRGQLKVVNNSYIPISKLKEKMELLREDIQYSANPLSIDNSKYAIEVLEELLEEGE